MGIINRMFNRHASDASHRPEPSMKGASMPDNVERVVDGTCAHVAITPRWDNIDDMGHDDRASSWVCDACHATLTPAEAAEARAKIGHRLHAG